MILDIIRDQLTIHGLEAGIVSPVGATADSYVGMTIYQRKVLIATLSVINGEIVCWLNSAWSNTFTDLVVSIADPELIHKIVNAVTEHFNNNLPQIEEIDKKLSTGRSKP